MENQIAIINPSELESVIKNSGLELVEGEQIKISYQPFLSQLAEIHEQASKIDFQNPKELDERIAGDLRKKTVKIRTGAAELKDSRKRIHLLKGNLEQACFNLIKTSCELTEETFVKVEKAREIAEKARKEQLRIERSQKLLQYCDNVSIYPLGEFTDQQFDDLFNGFKSTYEQKIEAEKQAELARIEKEKKEKLFNSRVNELAPYARFFVDLKITELCTETTENEFITMKTLCVNASSEYDKKQEHIRAENEKLKKEAELKEKALEAERVKAEQERKAIEEKNRIEREKQDAILKAEKEKAENEAKRKQAEFDAKQKADQLEREKLQKELQEKAEQERKIKEQQESELRKKQEAEFKAAKAPDKEKLTNWVNSFELPVISLCTKEESRNTYDEIIEKFDNFKKWAVKQIEQI